MPPASSDFIHVMSIYVICSTDPENPNLGRGNSLLFFLKSSVYEQEF